MHELLLKKIYIYMHCLDRGKLDSTFTFVADLTESSNRHLIIK